MSATLTHARAAESQARPTARSDASYGWLGFGVVALGVGLAMLALLGPLVFSVIDYRVSETLRNQTIGLDAVSLAWSPRLRSPSACSRSAAIQRRRRWRSAQPPIAPTC
jgi:hypothetical protein